MNLFDLVVDIEATGEIPINMIVFRLELNDCW